MVNESLTTKLERAVMLIETAWMDEEPMPCEVAARDQVKECIALIKQRQVQIEWNNLTPGMKLTVWAEYLWQRYVARKV